MPSREAMRPSACSGKHPYPSFAVAERVRRYSPAKVNVYHCKVCGGFHIGGNKPKSSRPDRRQRWTES